MKQLVAYLAGLLFGVGLILAGMTEPAKVMGFLDFLGDWDPSLALVMVGAIGVHGVLLRLVLRRAGPIFDARFHVPSGRQIDRPLVVGAAIFGVGWGLAGLCPGPGIVNLGTGAVAAVVFVVAMVLGSGAQSRLGSAAWQRAADDDGELVAG